MDDFGHEALEHLRTLTGRPDAAFHDGQLEAIRVLVEDHNRVLVVQRTGWGKSAVYFIATRMLRDRQRGPSILISPLIALMENQVDAARRMGVRAETINSTNTDAWDDLRARLEADEIDLLLVSEQRLGNETFRNRWLPVLAQGVGMFIVDEVHCISDWGHDFRPHYRRIGRFIDRLADNVPVIGCTATANDRVVADVETQLGAGIVTIRGPLRREGLRLEVHTDKRRPDARLAWLAENIPDLPGTGIIYCLTRGDVINVADFLTEHGVRCATYMGGGGADETADKQRTLQRFLANELDCIVATSALGMGYDKPDVAFVIHYQMPGSAIAYYQQVGRAGRTLSESFGILLAGTEDRDIQDWFIKQAFPAPEEVDVMLDVLESSDGPVGVARLESAVNVSRGRLQNLLVQLEVEGVISKEPGGWLRTTMAWEYPHDRVAQVNDWKRGEQAVMADYLATDECRMNFLQHQLDDPPTAPCGICDNCTSSRFGRDPDIAVRREADEQLRHAYVEVEPRKLWPAGLDEVSGRIPPAEQAEPGWCLARSGDAGWGESVRRDRIEGANFDDALVEAFAAMIEQQLGSPPADWIAFVPSQRHAGLVADLAARLGRRLGVPVAAVVTKVRDTEPQSAMHNSPAQVRNIWGAFTIEGSVPAGRCLLVDDLIDSRWTTTVIAHLLRGSGADTVSPVALAQAGQSDG